MAKGKVPVLNFVRPYHVWGKKWDTGSDTLAISRGVSSATALMGRVYLGTDVNNKAVRY